jgi:hypothetical protein
VTGVLTKYAHVPVAIRAALSVIGIAMLLSFPMYRAHQFQIHFRTPEIRRAIVRNTFTAQPEVTGGERVLHANYADAKIPPSVLAALVAPVLFKPVSNSPIVSEIIPTRFLLRSKPAPKPAGGSDPLS